MTKVFSFWEGRMPAYIELCIKTWKVPYVVLDYSTVNMYTDLPIEKIKRFDLPKVGDIVRIHVLRDQGGYWLDADTVMLTDQLPDTDLVGYPEERTSSAGLLFSNPRSEMFTEWARYQDKIINGTETPTWWATFVNDFSDPYAKEHKEIRIHPITDYWPETYMIQDNVPRYQKYQRFYFSEHHSVADIRPTDLLMLHNSWTPDWYKRLNADEVLDHNCTLSNVLRDTLRNSK